MCSRVCSVCYWLIGDVLLMYSGAVSLDCTYLVSMSVGVSMWLVRVVSVWQDIFVERGKMILLNDICVLIFRINQNISLTQDKFSEISCQIPQVFI